MERTFTDLSIEVMTRAPQHDAGSRVTHQALRRLVPRSRVVISSTSSHSHTWNLVFLELLLHEHEHIVYNLGPCVPISHLVQECLRHRPALIVLSSVNGHGLVDGLKAIRAIRHSP